MQSSAQPRNTTRLLAAPALRRRGEDEGRPTSDPTYGMPIHRRGRPRACTRPTMYSLTIALARRGPLGADPSLSRRLRSTRVGDLNDLPATTGPAVLENSRMNEDEMFSLIAAGRRRAADLFDQLNSQQLAVQSLCTAWTVHDMAGHLVTPFCVGVPRFALGSMFAGGFDKCSVEAACKLGQRPIGELTAILRKNAESHFTPPGHGPMAPLTDISVHTRVRRTAAPPPRLGSALHLEGRSHFPYVADGEARLCAKRPHERAPRPGHRPRLVIRRRRRRTRPKRGPCSCHPRSRCRLQRPERRGGSPPSWPPELRPPQRGDDPDLRVGFQSANAANRVDSGSSERCPVLSLSVPSREQGDLGRDTSAGASLLLAFGGRVPRTSR